MNEVMKALLERRTIRQYEDKAVPAELIEQIVEAGLYAPSSMGKQNSKIVVITDKELIHELSVVNNEIGGWAEGNDPFYGAPRCPPGPGIYRPWETKIRRQRRHGKPHAGRSFPGPWQLLGPPG